MNLKALLASPLAKKLSTNPYAKTAAALLTGFACNFLDSKLAEVVPQIAGSNLAVGATVTVLVHNLLSRVRDKALTLEDPTVMKQITGLTKP